jgi:hypothetical protein
MMKRLAIFSLLLSSPILSAQTHQYIVPVWAQDLRGSSQTWTSEISVSNPDSEAASVRVAEVYPAVEEFFCHPVIFCGPQIARQFESGDTLPVTPNFWKKNVIYRLAALRIESDRPIHVESWVRGISKGSLLNQEIAVGRGWIPAGAKAFIPERYYNVGGGTPDHTNVFIVNPNEAPMVVNYRIVYRGTHRPSDEERAITIAPKSLGQTPSVAAYRGEGNGDSPVFPRIELAADAQFYAVASDVDIAGDVIFRGPAVRRRE